MKIKRNKYIPFGNHQAINLFGVLFAKHGVHISGRLIRHEKIHTAQMKEMHYVFFYIWYGLEWFVKLFKHKNSHKAYKNISFEREAYSNEDDVIYLENRKRFAWIKY